MSQSANYSRNYFTGGKLTDIEHMHDFTDVVVFDYTDLKQMSADLVSQTTIATIPAGGAVELAFVHKATALVGAADITLDVGTAGADPDEFIDALDVDDMTAPAYNTGDAFTTASGTANKLILAGVVASDTAVVVEWNGTLGSLTAGKVVIGLRILDAGRFAK